MNQLWYPSFITLLQGLIGSIDFLSLQKLSSFEENVLILPGQAADQHELWLRLELVKERTDSSLLSCLECPVVTSLAAAGDERSLCELGKDTWVVVANAYITYTVVYSLSTNAQFWLNS